MAEMVENKYIPIRVTTVYPEYILGVSGGKYFTAFWQGYELAKIEFRQDEHKLIVTNPVELKSNG